MTWAIQSAALVERMVEPKLMPTPKRTNVPQPIRLWASFQLMMPMPGKSIRVIAANVVEEVSKGWRIFSVDHKKSKITEINISFFSSLRIGPSLASSLAIVF